MKLLRLNMLKTVTVTLLACMVASAATTQVQDTLYQADGVTKFSGVLRISWGTFLSTADGLQHPAGTLITNIRLGALNQALEPNDATTPSGTFYTVNYQLSNGTNMFECWQVPTSGSPVNLATVRVSPSICGTSFPVAGTIPISSIQPGADNTWLNTNNVGVVQWNPLSGVFPSGTQLEYLRIQPNTGNNTTTQFSSLPIVNAGDFNFPAQTPGGMLTGGTPATVTFTPCPLGVTGSDAHHWLYVSGGTGTAEVVIITGGTCTGDGLTSGNITFTPTNTHTGAWTVQTASGGIQEALQNLLLAGNGGIVSCTGSITLRALTTVPANEGISGPTSGGCTLNAATSNTAPWAASSMPYSVIYTTSNSTVLQNFTLNLTSSTYASSAIGSNGGSNGLISGIVFKGIPAVSNGVYVFVLGGSANNIVGNWMFGPSGGCGGTQGAGGIDASTSYSYIAGNFATGLCNTEYGAASGSTIQGNVAIAPSSRTSGNQMYAVDSASNVRFVNNYCDGGGTSVAECFTTAQDVTGTGVKNVTFANNFATNCSAGIFIDGTGSTNQTQGATLSNNQVWGCATGDHVTGWVSDINITGDIYMNNTSNGLYLDASAFGAGGVISNLIVNGIVADLNGPASASITGGIAMNPNGSNAVGNNISIVNSILSDSASSGKTQNEGIVIYGSGTVTGLVISNNQIYGNISGSINFPSGLASTTVFTHNYTNDSLNEIDFSLPLAFSSLISCSSANQGAIARVNNSTTATWGATITNGGTNKVLAYCDGTNWTVTAE